VLDVVSGSVNDQLTRGGVVQLKGGRLKLALDNPDNGIFVVSNNGTTARCEVVVENKPARLIAVLPWLVAGNYHIEVRTTLGTSGREGKTLKTGRFAKEFTVIIPAGG
jgi:hypothetical protein